MALSLGTRLGPYAIQSPLGAGGMGEVYKATDTRLDRTVAVKVLPAHVASDPELRQRFEREAKTLAALSHPHICPIHDVGSQNGIDFLVMEYLEGETLADRLMKGALPIEQALRISIQIADALAAAHRAGIVHRDLKPGNIMLTKAGAKLLDLGLAKSAVPAAAGSLSMLPTTPPGLTVQGTILGTFQYMAPEQLEGQEAEARTDIFAFGLVLYEMLTGRKAFEGKSQASLIGAILKDPPPRLSTLCPEATASLERVVAKAMAKQPDARWQSASDLCDELRWLTLLPAPGGSIVDGRPRRPSWVVALIAVVAGALAVATAQFALRSTPSVPQTLRLEVSTPPTSDPVSLAISPDSRQLVFVADGEDRQPRLWLRTLSTLTSQPLPDTVGARGPFWSPDSRSIAFFAAGKLRRLDIGSTSSITVADAANARGGSWNSDGVILYAPTAGGPLYRVRATGGESIPATKLDPSRQTGHRLPAFLPDGRHFLFFVQGTQSSQGVYLGSLDSEDTTLLTAADTNAVYTPTGFLVFGREGKLLARRLALDSLRLEGDVLTVDDTVAVNEGAFTAGMSVAADGTIAYRRATSLETQLAWFDRSGMQVGTIGPPVLVRTPRARISADGSRIVMNDTRQRNTDLWIVETSRVSRLTFDPNVDDYPVWSPDGTRIAFRSNRGGARSLYVKSAQGDGPERPLLESPENKTTGDWSPDGKYVIYHLQRPDSTDSDIMALPVAGGKPLPVVSTNSDERNSSISPDGRWVAYASNPSGDFEVYVRPFLRDGGVWQISNGGGMHPQWRADGKELFYVRADGMMMATSVIASADGISADAPHELFRTPMVGLTPYEGVPYGVARDGRFLVSVPVSTSTPIVVLMNWNRGIDK